MITIISISILVGFAVFVIAYIANTMEDVSFPWFYDALVAVTYVSLSVFVVLTLVRFAIRGITQ